MEITLRIGELLAYLLLSCIFGAGLVFYLFWSGDLKILQMRGGENFEDYRESESSGESGEGEIAKSRGRQHELKIAVGRGKKSNI